MRFNLPPCTRVLVLAVILWSLLWQALSIRTKNAADNVIVPSIALTPQYSIYYPWTYLTTSFAEQNFFTMAIGIATVSLAGRYLERVWGSREYLIFILVVTVIPNLIAAALYVFAFVVVRSDALAVVSIQGTISIQASFLVAFKQLVPEHTVEVMKGVIKFRVKHMPAVFVILNTISGFIFFTDTAAILTWLGFLTSWTYLRFYKPQLDLSGANTGGSHLRGDASETFAFAYFWPDAIHGPVSAVSNAVFNSLVLAKICTPFSEEEVENSRQAASARESGLPTMTNSDARYNAGKRKEAETERRRNLALKQLDQRLQAAAATRSAPTVSASASASTVPPSSEEPGTSIVETAGSSGGPII